MRTETTSPAPIVAPTPRSVLNQTPREIQPQGEEEVVTPRCATCSNEYEKAFQVIMNGKTYHFDCFECAIQLLAPSCARCGCTIIGHGLEHDQEFYCSPHCARHVNKPIAEDSGPSDG